MAGALSKVRVLDLSRILAGPWATQLLADLGAEVIKIERPGTGDDTRNWGPPFMSTPEGEATADAAYFHTANRGKYSLAVDITHPEGQALIRRLVAECDVLVENFKVDGLKKYGLDYASLRSVNPGLIYCSITGFGQTGPYRHRAGYDFMIQGMGGLMSLTGEPEGMPMKVGVALADVMTGLYAGNAILGALYHKAQTGEGQHIDLGLLDVQVATLANQAMNYLARGRAPQRLGNAHPNIVPYQAFATADGHLILAVGNDGQYRRFCEVAGCPELADEAPFATNRARVENRQQLIPRVAELMAARPTAWWLERLAEVGVPCGPINTLDQVFEDPQVQARELRLELEHTEAGRVPGVANPIRFSATPIEYRSAPPVLGEHSEQVLTTYLSLDETEIARLRASGVIG